MSTKVLLVINTLLNSNYQIDILETKEFKEFMSESNVLFIKIFDNETALLTNSNSKDKFTNKQIKLLIYKTTPKELTYESFFDNTCMTTCKGNSFSVISNEINNTLIPKVQSNLKDSSGIISYFEDFNKRLKTIEERLFNESVQINMDENDYSLIFSPIDEVNNWKAKSNTTFTSILESLRAYLTHDSNEINSIFKENVLFKIIDKIFSSIIELSQKAFNLRRLRHFTIIVCDYLSWKINSELEKINLNDSIVLAILQQINNSLKQANYKIDNIDLILKNDYVQYNKTSLFATQQKINSLIEIKGTINEMSKLGISNDQSISIKGKLDNIDLLKASINNDLVNVESQILVSLENQIMKQSSEHVLTLLREMSNYKQLFQRSNIVSKTMLFREGLLNQLIKYTQGLRDYYDNNLKDNIDENVFNTNARSNTEKIPEISSKVSTIIFGHSIKSKVDNAKKLGVVFLQDLKLYSTFNTLADKLLLDVNSYISDCLLEWSNQFGKISDLLPNTKSNLFEVNSQTGQLKVNFSDSLFSLISDCRVLIEYDFIDKIHKDILNVYEEGKKMHKDAITLKQIANFYNTLSSQVAPCLQPMLLSFTKKFDENLKYLIQKSKLTDKKNSLDNFVVLVQNAASELMSEIRKLKQTHSDILDLIIQLTNYDLISNRNKWRDNLKKARLILSDTCESYSNELTIEWKNHWNYQLYKVLKIQYSISLSKFFTFLPQIDCFISIKNNSIMLEPAKEEIKKIIFKEIKSFISIPILIQGFTEECDYYKNLLSDNKDQITSLYSKINMSVESLNAKIINLNEYTGFLSINYDSFSQENFETYTDWKVNMDILKKTKKEIQTMEDVTKVECFKVNINSYKEYFDNFFENVLDSLTVSLKDKINSSVKQIDDFIKQAFTYMTKKPSSLQEILEFKQSFVNITRNKAKFMKQCDEVDEMNKLVFQATGISIDLSGLSSRWNNFDTMIGNYNNMLEEQKQEIKKEMHNKMKTLNDQLEKFMSKFQAYRVDSNYVPDKDSDLTDIANGIKSSYDEFSSIENNIQLIIDDCINFDLEQPDLTQYQKIKDELTIDKTKWSTFFDFNNEYLKLSNEDWLGIRYKAFGLIQDFVLNYSDKMKKRQNKDFIYMHITKELNTIRESLNTYKYLIGDNFERDHWKTLFNLLKIDNKITKETLKFGHFLEKTDILVKKANDIRDLYSRAQGEILIRNSMSELIAWFESCEFIFYEYNHVHTQKGTKVTPLIKEWKDIMNDISEKQSLLITIKSSEYFSRFQDQIEQYDMKFTSIETWLTQLNHIQRKWVYLEPIFSRGSLPKEASRFKKIDDEFRGIMMNLNNSNKVQTLFNIPNIKETLLLLIEQLEKCQKALNDFLEDKRNKYARLYFLGDDDLLEFLAKSKDQGIIKNNLKKLFQGITNLKYDDQAITYIGSLLDEKVKLNKKVILCDELEVWLNNLTSEMMDSLKTQLNQSLKEFMTGNAGDKIDFSYLDNTSSQIACVIEQLVFAIIADKAIKNNSLKTLLNGVSSRLSKLAIYQTGKHSKEKLFKCKNLMLDLIHNKEVAEVLYESQVNDIMNWEWYRQFKYSFISVNKDNMLKTNMCDGIFDYTFEYQGSSQKLVHTPLTDKCYITLTQALKLGYGGNPYGPAGTGKTETVKALGQAFGRQVLVFNCDEGIDFNAMGRIFIGLTKCGAWGCFDEFNRLLEEQLSAISIQIQIIQNAIKQKTTEITLLSSFIQVNFNSAIFVTLNPASKAYGGRSKLPDNLKMLFRPVAMSIPDNQQIAKTLLYSEGFKYSDILSKKVVSLFQLCKNGLSNQIHYDWGLRSLKTILTVANQQIQELLTNDSSGDTQLSLLQETNILIKAIRINVLSKLTFADSTRFNLLVTDVFPDVKSISDIEYKELSIKLLEIYKEKNLQFIEPQLKKIVQFHEALKQKMGVVLVGPSGCGKSTIWDLLRLAYNKMGISVVTKIINPKSMPRKQLLGYMNHDTGEYLYGVLTKNAKEVEKEPLSTQCWIICDGDVDPEWIEALNSVLDDNRLLTMQNGERISFTNNVNFIFETDSLKFASPATVSRLGIIYMNQEDLDNDSIIRSYLNNLSEEDKLQCNGLFENHFHEIFNSLNNKEDYNLMLKSTNYGIIQNCLSLVTSNNNQIKPFENKIHFADSIVKGLGSFLSYSERKKFALEVYNKTSERFTQMMSNPLNVYYDSNSLSIKEYIFDDDEKIDIKEFNTNTSYPIVKTPSIQRDYSIIKLWFDQELPFVIVGHEGVGKSLLINHLLSNNPKGKYSVCTINCTSRTNSSSIIQKLNQSCVISNSSKGKILRPKDAQRLVLIIKDINLPKPDKYETIQLISFIQELITYNGYYSSDLEFVHLDKIQIICSMNPSSTIGRYDITSRLTGKIKMIYIDYPQDNELCLIYTKYLESILQYIDNTSEEDKKNKQKSIKLESYSKQLSEHSVKVYSQILIRINQQENIQCKYNPRDLSTWIISILRYEEYINDNENKANRLSNLIDIWIYESIRIFKDKLISSDQKGIFDKILQTEVNSIISNNKQYLSDKNINLQLYLCSFDSTTSKVLNNTYLLNNMTKEDFIEQCLKGQMIYERDNQDINLFLHDDILNNIKIIDRILTFPISNLLLIGKTGIGRKKAVRIAAANRHYEFFYPTLSVDYSKNEFRKDLKSIYQTTAIESKSLIFFIEEHHFSQSNDFTEYINSLICSGEVPGLLTNEEMDGLLGSLVNEFKEQNEYRTSYDLLISKVRKNLRIVILVDPSNKDYNSLLLNNPSFITKCNVVWFDECSDKINTDLINNELKDIYLKLNKQNDKSSKNISSIILNIYNSLSQSDKDKRVELVYTQQKLISFILQFKDLYLRKVNNSQDKIKHLIQGLEKIEEAEKFVVELNIKAAEQQKEIEIKQGEASSALEQITNSMQIASNKKEQLKGLNIELENENSIVNENKLKVEGELQDVLPYVEEAKKLVKSIDNKALSELTSFFRQKILKPEVYSVLKATMTVLGQFNLNSEEIREKFNSSAVSALMSLDLNRLSYENMKQVEKIVSEHQSHFVKETTMRISKSLGNVSEFINSMVKYYHAKEAIKPLEDKLIEAENKMLKTKKVFDQNKKELDKMDLQILSFKQSFQEKTQKAEELKYEQKLTLEKVIKSTSLLGKLSSEKNRWKEQIIEIESNNSLLPYNCIISSAFIVFLGYFNEAVRSHYIKTWESIVSSELGSIQILTKLSNFLIDESETLKLKSQGLPSDQLSLENVILLRESVKTNTKLLIDPVENSTDWFKKHFLNESNHTVISISNKKLLTELELAIRFGKEVLITDLDKVESLLIPLIRRETTKIGARTVIKLGEKTIDLNDNFKLYLSTRDESIDLSSFIMSSITTINFSVTRSGLESLVLGITIEMEQPELEHKKNELLQQQSNIKLELSNVEKQLLQELINLDGNLLENKTLIASLEDTKDKAIKSEIALNESIVLSENIDNKRNIYLPLSILATDVFILLQNMYKINPMYRYSLNNFIEIFKQSILSCSSSDNKIKLDSYKSNFISQAYYYYARTVFKSDLLSYGLYFIRNINNKSVGDRNDLLWEFLLGNTATNIKENNTLSINLPTSFPIDRKDITFSFIKIFNDEYSSLVSNNMIETILSNEKLSLELILSLLNKNTNKQIQINTNLFCLILIQCIRPDQLETLMRDFICKEISIKSIVPESISLSSILHNEKNSIPILFNTSLGSDPSKEIEELAIKNIGIENFIEIPIGAGNTEKILQTIREAIQKGKWVCLKNIHLSISFIKQLEKEVKYISTLNSSINSNYRLWLTSEPHSNISTILLESCYKLSYETPPGVKQSIDRIYINWEANLFSDMNPTLLNNPITQQSLFNLSYLHALLQERRTYIPQGWSKFYEFSFSDLKVTYETLIEYLSRATGDDSNLWNNLKGLMKITFYGGRVDNDFDMQILTTYIDIILNTNSIKSKGNKIFHNINTILSESLVDYKNSTSLIPDSNNPNIFGLPLSVDKSVQRFVSSETISKILCLYSISSANSSSIKYDKDTWTIKLAPIINLWNDIFKQDSLLTLEKLLSKINNKGDEEIGKEPILAHLKTEAETIISLVKCISGHISLIENVLFSNGVISSDLFNICLNLLVNVTPLLWQKIWEGSESPQFYLKSITKKLVECAKYLSSEGKMSTVNLNHMLYPETFLNSLKQKTARLMKKPIDELTIGFSFAKMEKAAYSIQVNGLLLQGSVDKGYLISSFEKVSKEELTILPSVYFYFYDSSVEKKKETIEIPIYDTIFRERFICKLDFEYKGDKSDLILQGIAICLDS